MGAWSAQVCAACATAASLALGCSTPSDAGGVDGGGATDAPPVAVGDAAAPTYPANGVSGTILVDIPGGGTPDVTFNGKRIGSGTSVAATLSVAASGDKLLVAHVPGSKRSWASLLSNTAGHVHATGGDGSLRIDARTTAATLIQMAPQFLADTGETNAVVADVLWSAPEVDQIASWLSSHPDDDLSQSSDFIAQMTSITPAIVTRLNAASAKIAATAGQSPTSARRIAAITFTPTVYGAWGVGSNLGYTYAVPELSADGTSATLQYERQYEANVLGATLPISLFSLDALAHFGQIDKRAFDAGGTYAGIMDVDHAWTFAAGTEQLNVVEAKTSLEMIDLVGYAVDTIVKDVVVGNVEGGVGLSSSQPKVDLTTHGAYSVRFVYGSFGGSDQQKAFIANDAVTNLLWKRALLMNASKVALKAIDSLVNVDDDPSIRDAVVTSMLESIAGEIPAAPAQTTAEQVRALVDAMVDAAIATYEKASEDAAAREAAGALKAGIDGAENGVSGGLTSIGDALQAFATLSQMAVWPLESQVVVSGRWEDCATDGDCTADFLCCDFPRCIDNGTPNTCLPAQCGDNICSAGEATSCPQDCTCNAANASPSACDDTNACTTDACAQSGGAWACTHTSTQAIGCPGGPSVTDVSPKTATVGEPTNFTVSGANLPSTLTVVFANCAGLALDSVTPTGANFTCTPAGAGVWPGSIYEKPNDLVDVISSFDVTFDAPGVDAGPPDAGAGDAATVDASVADAGAMDTGVVDDAAADACVWPAVPADAGCPSYPCGTEPTVTSVTPAVATAGVVTTFTITGTSLPSSLAAFIPNCLGLTIDPPLPTSATFHCTPDPAQAGTTQPGVVKDVSGCEPLATFGVSFAEPADAASDAGAPDATVGADSGAGSDAGGSTGPSIWAIWPIAPDSPGTAAYTSSASGDAVLDTVTELTWQARGGGGTYTLSQATDYCAALGADGGGWRLPTRIELASIVDFARFSPAVYEWPFADTASSWHWSASPYAGTAGSGWYVDFSAGQVGYRPTTDAGNVRCVRDALVTPTAPWGQSYDGVVPFAQWPIASDSPGPSAYVISASGDAIRDTLTNLTWQAISGAQTVTWLQAASTCASLAADGGGWRLPTRMEAVSLVDFQRFSPAIYEWPFQDTPASWFWTSSPYVGTAGDAWYVDFTTGQVSYRAETDTGYVRCVRDGAAAPDGAFGQSYNGVVPFAQWSIGPDSPPSSSYVVTADTVTDPATGLMWERSATPAGSTAWIDALHYCGGLALDGTGWRLPTRVELASIVDFGRFSPAIYEWAFPATPAAPFWSLSPYASSAGSAWYVDFSTGQVGYTAVSTAYAVRCVRDAAGQSGGPGMGASACGDCEWAAWAIAPDSPGASLVSGGGGVYDQRTGRTWSVTSSALVSQQAAASYCAALGGSWRLPSRIELASIVDFTRSSPAIDTSLFPGTASEAFWSASSYAGTAGTAWFVNFSSGQVGYQATTATAHARCVE